MRKFGQTNVLTGKVAGTKELRRTVYKEQNGVRPKSTPRSAKAPALRGNPGCGRGWFRDKGVQGRVEKKSEGRKNFGNQNSRNGKGKTISPWRTRRTRKKLEKKATTDCADVAEFYRPFCFVRSA